MPAADRTRLGRAMLTTPWIGCLAHKTGAWSLARSFAFPIAVTILQRFCVGFSEKIACKKGNLGAIVRLDLAHDVANMDLDGAFAHAELVGDDLVGFTLAQSVEDLDLPVGKQVKSRLAAPFGIAGWRCTRGCISQAIGWDVDTTGPY